MKMDHGRAESADAMARLGRLAVGGTPAPLTAGIIQASMGRAPILYQALF